MPITSKPKRQAAPSKPHLKSKPVVAPKALSSAVTPLVRAESAPVRPDLLTLAVLVGCLALSAVALYGTINAASESTALEESRNLLLDNYSRAIERQAADMNAVRRAAAEKEKPPPPARPPILWSVVQFREGEQAAIESNLAGPLLDWQLSRDLKPTAVLIERRQPTSINVSARLFLEDGTENQFYWPESGSVMEGLWLPPCGPNSPEGEPAVTCPPEFLEKYPAVTEGLLKLIK
jgi:hypothetical protein